MGQLNHRHKRLITVSAGRTEKRWGNYSGSNLRESWVLSCGNFRVNSFVLESNGRLKNMVLFASPPSPHTQERSGIVSGRWGSGLGEYSGFRANYGWRNLCSGKWRQWLQNKLYKFFIYRHLHLKFSPSLRQPNQCWWSLS